jgi:uncharacterized RDD family membrane protein YckC
MPDAGSFVATPEKRFAAALIDIVLVMVIAVLAHVFAKAIGYPADFASLIAIVYFAYHAGFLHNWNGQSPGRRTLDISVVSARGAPLTFLQAILRSGLRPLCCFIPSGGLLALGLPQIDPVTSMVVATVEFVLLAFVPSRRTSADLLAGAIVVNTPPPQPYRAPAVPMYSATDAEFGYPPRKGPKDRGDGK